MRRAALRVAALVALYLWPHLTEKLIDHIVLGAMLVWLGWEHSHSPPKH